MLAHLARLAGATSNGFSVDPTYCQQAEDCESCGALAWPPCAWSADAGCLSLLHSWESLFPGAASQSQRRL